MKRISRTEYQRRIQQKYPLEKFEIIQYEYYNAPAILKCQDCGAIIKLTRASSFLNKNKRNGCVYCKGNKSKLEKDKETLLKKYEILDSYVYETHRHYIVKCKQCGHIRDAILSCLLNSPCGCEKNGYYRKRTPEEFIKQVNEASNDEFELVGEYINQATKVKLRHKKCGFIRNVWPHDVVRKGCSCPKCYPLQSRESKMVRYITKILEEKNIIFDKEVPLQNSKQRFDFMLYFNNNKQVAIEFNGAQHYEETNFFSSSLKDIQARDKKKINYCKQHNIPLVIIPYYKNKKEILNIIENIISSTTIA